MSSYQSRLLTEGIRVIEKSPLANTFQADYRSLSLEAAIDKRTQLAELRYQVQPVFKHFEYLLKLLTGLFGLLFFIIGASGVSQLLVNEQSTQINFFWVLILFILPNLFSLCLWLLLYFKTGLVNMSWVANICLSSITMIDKLHHKASAKHRHYAALFRFFFSHRFSRYIGRSQLSFISHYWWGCYLLGATLSVILVLATHQVDFIWQTTILSEQTFLTLTELLTYLPTLLQIDVPSAQDVLHANLNEVNSLSMAQHIRISWSNLLLFSLIVYALLPRLLLMAYFAQRLRVLKSRFKLDLTMPYYVQLKSILHPVSQPSFIQDPDNQQMSQPPLSDATGCQPTQQVQFSTLAYPVATELTEVRMMQATQHVSSYSQISLLNALDGASQQQVLMALNSEQPKQVTLYADIQRTPDRGWLSFVKQCRTQDGTQLHLVLLGGADIDPGQLLKRLTVWGEVATQASIQQAHISYLLDN